VPTRWYEQHVSLDRHGHFALTNKAHSDNPESGSPLLLDLESGQELFMWGYFLTGSGKAGGMLSPGGRWLIQPFGWNKLRIIQIATKLMTQVQVGDDDQTRVGQYWCFTPDEKKLVCSCDNRVIVIDLQSGAFQFAPVQAHPEPPSIRAITISPNGELAALATEESIQIWELSGKDVLASLDIGHSSTLVFDPQNRYLITGGYQIPLCCFELRRLAD
jgi:WD40 repeat protein